MPFRIKTVKPSLFAIAAGLVATACVSGPGANEARVKGAPLGVQSAVAPPPGTDPIAEAAFWGTRYDRAPGDKDAAVAFSQALRRIGSLKEAASVIQKSAAAHPNDAALQLELGKILVADNRAYQGVQHIENAVQAGMTDWRTRSAYGVALDQIGAHREAQAQYDLALAAAPEETTVLNNKALSLALAGRLDDAEWTLRAAAGRGDASAQIRQNLALILGLKGEFREAERLARADLPPQVADNNIAYFRGLLSQPAYWNDLDTVDFDAIAEAETAPAPEPIRLPDPIVDVESVEMEQAKPLSVPPAAPALAVADEEEETPFEEGQTTVIETTPASLSPIVAPQAVEPAPLKSIDG
ncbi:MAG: hypothetical protein AAGC95_07470 [Pseudomonadota bacterium]